MRLLLLLVLCVVFIPSAQAHESHNSTAFPVFFAPVTVLKNFVVIKEDGQYRYIKSNGIPHHKTGAFPNRANPNAVSAQSHNYRVSMHPRKSGGGKTHEGVMGVALNGVPFEPGTAECYERSRGQRGPMHSCEWREEAIVNGNGQLGLDQNNAHVQPTGAYHYHGLPHGLLSVLPKDDLVHVGYAADGFKIYVSRSGAYKPSYKLKSGTRPSGPGGRYDGKYTADYVYAAAKVGDLDECNGGTYVNGEYVYFMTEGFPFAPRCLMGRVDSSFSRGRPSSDGPVGNSSRFRPERGGHRP